MKPTQRQNGRAAVGEEKERLAAARRARVPPAARESFLRLGTIRDSTRRLYSDALTKFESWAKPKRYDLGNFGSTDTAMENYFAELYFDGFGPAEGRNVLYRYIHFNTHLDRNKANLFPRASRALRGWTTRAPQRVRDPIPSASSACWACTSWREGSWASRCAWPCSLTAT